MFDSDDDDWTEARAISSGTENGEVKSSSDAVAEENEELDEELTPVLLSSSPSNENTADESETVKASTDLLETELAATLVEPNETDMAVREERRSVPDLENIYQAETPSSNVSEEESSVPTSNNSIDAHAVVTTTGDGQSLDSALSSDTSLSAWSALSDAKIGEGDPARLTAPEKLSVADEVQVMETPSNDSIDTKGSGR